MDRKKYIFLLILLALVFRIGLNIVREKYFFHKSFIYDGEEYTKNSVISDSIWYDQAARGFLSGKGTVSMDDTIVPRKYFPKVIETELIGNGPYYAHKIIPPVYPLFLAFCYKFGGINTLSYFIPQLLLSILTCILIFLLAAEFFPERVARIAGLAVALYPDLIFWTNTIRTETLFIFLLILSFYLVIRGYNRRNIAISLLGALCFGIASLTRITLLPFLPFLLVWLVREYHKRLVIPLLMAVIVLLSLFPWCFRNYRIFGKFSPLSDEVNVVFAGESWNEDENIKEMQQYYNSHNSTVIRIAAFIKDHFVEYSISSIGRFAAFWSPFRHPNKPLAKVYKTITWILIFPSAFYGIFLSVKNKKGTGLIILFIAYYAMLHAFSAVDDGLVYRYPIQPFLCIFAAFAFVSVFCKQDISAIDKTVQVK